MVTEGGENSHFNGEISNESEMNDDFSEQETLLPKRFGTVSLLYLQFNLLLYKYFCHHFNVAFKQAGLWMGFSLVFLMGFLNAHCMLMLVHSAQYLCQKTGKLELDYGHLAKKSVDFGIERWQDHSRKALSVKWTNLELECLYVVNAVIAVLQVGVGSVQLVFMASHMKEVFEHYDQVDLHTNIYMFILLIPVILLIFVRTLRVLTMFSIVGNALMIIVFLVIFQRLVQPPNELANLPPITNFGQIVTACGSILYAFEGQAIVLPMENKMQNPEQMIGIFGVLSTGMMLVTTIYVATGFFGFATYGEDVLGSITLNLPATPLYNCVKFLLVLVVYMSYSIQMYILVEMLWPAIRRKLLHGYQQVQLLVLEYVFKAGLVVLTLLIAVLVPKLELIIPLVGVSAGMILAFVFPPIIETVVFWSEWQSVACHLKWLHFSKNAFLITIGILGLLFGITATLQNIINNYNK